MSASAVALLASTSLYAGFQWTIRVLVYPQFAAVPAKAFGAFERSHQRRTAITVGPLFVLFGVSALFAVFDDPSVITVVAAGCFAVILLTTGLAAVPRHRQLSEGFDTAVLTELLRVDSVRLGAAVVACAAAVFNMCR